MNESELIARLKGGDENAFRSLFDLYSPMIYNVCIRMTGNREDAQDATQDVFIKVERSIKRFRGDAKLSSWIYRIAVNTCLNRQRRKKLASMISLDFLLEGEDAPHFPSHEATPDEQLEQSESVHIVQQAIQALPARQKTAVILHRYEHLSYQEIARIMKIGVPAVESLLHRAKENLAKQLLSFKS